MTASIQAKSNGTQGSLQVNGADAVVFDSTGIVSGDTNTLNKTIGVNQTWQNVTGSRAFGTTYYNTTGKPIAVSGFGVNSAGLAYTPNVNGLGINTWGRGADGYTPFFFIVPVGNSYSIIKSGTSSSDAWYELR